MTEKQVMMAIGYIEMADINKSISEEHMAFEGKEYLTSEQTINKINEGER